LVEEKDRGNTNKMRSVPARKWLAVLLPGVFGSILLIAGAVAAADADAWLTYALAAVIGATLPLLYTLQLAREHRLFLGKSSAVASRRRRVARLMPVGWLLGAVALVVLIAVGDSGKTVLYGVLGGAAFGIWPGLVANFIRLWREEWQSRA
jgi:hypothetical protein